MEVYIRRNGAAVATCMRCYTRCVGETHSTGQATTRIVNRHPQVYGTERRFVDDDYAAHNPYCPAGRGVGEARGRSRPVSRGVRAVRREAGVPWHAGNGAIAKKVFEQRVFDIKDFNEISIEDMIIVWDVSDNEQLVILTARIFLEIEDEKKISKLPLIDFLRLTSHLETISKLVANEFKKISRESEDPKIRNILSKYKGSAFDMLDRFCRLYPAYKIEEVKKMDWNTVLQAFISETKHNDIQTEINEL